MQSSSSSSSSSASSSWFLLACLCCHLWGLAQGIDRNLTEIEWQFISSNIGWSGPRPNYLRGAVLFGYAGATDGSNICRTNNQFPYGPAEDYVIHTLIRPGTGAFQTFSPNQYTGNISSVATCWDIDIPPNLADGPCSTLNWGMTNLTDNNGIYHSHPFRVNCQYYNMNGAEGVQWATFAAKSPRFQKCLTGINSTYDWLGQPNPPNNIWGPQYDPPFNTFFVTPNECYHFPPNSVPNTDTYYIGAVSMADLYLLPPPDPHPYYSSTAGTNDATKAPHVHSLFNLVLLSFMLATATNARI